MKKWLLYLMILIVALFTFGCGEKYDPIAAKFNSYIGQVAGFTQVYQDLQQKLIKAQNLPVTDQVALIDQSILQMKSVRKGIEGIPAPEELADLKELYLNANDIFSEGLDIQKKQLLAKDNFERADLGEDAELVSGKTISIYSQIDDFIKVVEEVYHVKCPKRSAVASPVKVKGNKYFLDQK